MQLKTILFGVGFLITVQVFMFPAALRHVPSVNAGAATGFVNTTTMLAGAIFQKLVGSFLDYFWTGDCINGLPFYNITCYRKALSVLIFFMVFGAFVGWQIRPPKQNSCSKD